MDFNTFNIRKLQSCQFFIVTKGKALVLILYSQKRIVFAMYDSKLQTAEIRTQSTISCCFPPDTPCLVPLSLSDSVLYLHHSPQALLLVHFFSYP